MPFPSSLDYIVPSQFRPLPKSLRGTACYSCEKLQSSWWVDAFNPEDQEAKVYACSLCLMYETVWGRKLRSSIEEVILRVEASRDAKFESDSSNRLTLSSDADHVLGAIVLAQRASVMHRGNGSIGEAS